MEKKQKERELKNQAKQDDGSKATEVKTAVNTEPEEQNVVVEESVENEQAGKPVKADEVKAGKAGADASKSEEATIVEIQTEDTNKSEPPTELEVAKGRIVWMFKKSGQS